MGKSPSSATKWLLGIGIGLGLLMLLCCCGIGGFVFWLFGSGQQVPTLSIATHQSIVVLHGKPDPNDAGVQDLLEHFAELISQTQGELPEEMPEWARRFFEQSQRQNIRSFQAGANMVLPRELTLVIEQPTKEKDEPIIGAAINLPRFTNIFRLALRTGGQTYKEAIYKVEKDDGTVFGFYGGTLLFAEDETTLRQIVDRIEQTANQPLSLSLQHLHGDFDFIGIIKPRQMKTLDYELPTETVELGIDIVNADEWQGDSVWLCRNEKEAKMLAVALGRFRSELAQSAAKSKLNLAFEGTTEGNRYRLRFSLTGIKTWLKREFQETPDGEQKG